MHYDGKDLLIVGAGTLGRMVGVAWLADYPHATVVAETRTTEKHEALAALGLQPTVAESTAHSGPDSANFPYVLFCSPPSASDDYAALAANTAARTAPGGRLVFTSAASVYAVADGVMNENAPLATDSPRAKRLLDAERAILSVPGGSVLRLSGLYTVERGPHNYYLGQTFVNAAKDGLLNMLHYEDAASAVRRCLEAPYEVAAGKTFLIAGAPITREDVCKAARLHPLYAGRPMPAFDDTEQPVNRILDCTVSKLALDWEPKHPSFRLFFEEESRLAALQSAAA